MHLRGFISALTGRELKAQPSINSPVEERELEQSESRLALLWESGVGEMFVAAYGAPA